MTVKNIHNALIKENHACKWNLRFQNFSYEDDQDILLENFSFSIR